MEVLSAASTEIHWMILKLGMYFLCISTVMWQNLFPLKKWCKKAIWLSSKATVETTFVWRTKFELSQPNPILFKSSDYHNSHTFFPKFNTCYPLNCSIRKFSIFRHRVNIFWVWFNAHANGFEFAILYFQVVEMAQFFCFQNLTPCNQNVKALIC